MGLYKFSYHGVLNDVSWTAEAPEFLPYICTQAAKKEALDLTGLWTKAEKIFKAVLLPDKNDPKKAEIRLVLRFKDTFGEYAFHHATIFVSGFTKSKEIPPCGIILPWETPFKHTTDFLPYPAVTEKPVDSKQLWGVLYATLNEILRRPDATNLPLTDLPILPNDIEHIMEVGPEMSVLASPTPIKTWISKATLEVMTVRLNPKGQEEIWNSLENDEMYCARLFEKIIQAGLSPLSAVNAADELKDVLNYAMETMRHFYRVNHKSNAMVYWLNRKFLWRRDAQKKTRLSMDYITAASEGFFLPTWDEVTKVSKACRIPESWYGYKTDDGKWVRHEYFTAKPEDLLP